jgi:hypothetical protein
MIPKSMKPQKLSVLLAASIFTFTTCLPINPINAQNRHRNNYGLGMDLIWYCSYKYGSSARLVLRENNAYGWKCEVDRQYLAIDTSSVCRVMYGSTYQATMGNFNDSDSWYCAEASSSEQTSFATAKEGNLYRLNKISQSGRKYEIGIESENGNTFIKYLKFKSGNADYLVRFDRTGSKISITDYKKGVLTASRTSVGWMYQFRKSDGSTKSWNTLLEMTRNNILFSSVNSFLLGKTKESYPKRSCKNEIERVTDNTLEPILSGIDEFTDQFKETYNTFLKMMAFVNPRFEAQRKSISHELDKVTDKIKKVNDDLKKSVDCDSREGSPSTKPRQGPVITRFFCQGQENSDTCRLKYGESTKFIVEYVGKDADVSSWKIGGYTLTGGDEGTISPPKRRGKIESGIKCVGSSGSAPNSIPHFALITDTNGLQMSVQLTVNCY